MPRRIFVTGGGGFLGTHVVSRLRADGHEVAAPTRSELDLTDAAAVQRMLEHERAQVVVHLAASLDRRLTPEGEEAQWRDTFATGRAVLSAAERAGVELVVASGSMDEVGASEGMIPVDAPLHPVSTYGFCKSMVLRHAQHLSSTHGLQVEWFRPATIYGPGQGPGPMLVPTAFMSGMSGERMAFTSGEQRRDFIYVDDVVAWVAAAAALEVDGRGVTVHHVGSGAPIAVADVLRGIESLVGGTFALGELPRRPGEPDLLGVQLREEERPPLREWRPSTSLRDGLAMTAAWWRERSH